MSIQTLLSRLDKVKSTGNGRWTCSCPSHNDKSPSMHIKLDDNGKILINCKAGCGAQDIVSAIGMSLGDLMPDSPKSHKLEPRKPIIYATEALELIRFEAQIIMACAYAMKKGTLNLIDLDRAEQAMQTINKCLELTK